MKNNLSNHSLEEYNKELKSGVLSKQLPSSRIKEKQESGIRFLKTFKTIKIFFQAVF